MQDLADCIRALTEALRRRGEDLSEGRRIAPLEKEFDTLYGGADGKCVPPDRTHEIIMLISSPSSSSPPSS